MKILEQHHMFSLFSIFLVTVTLLLCFYVLKYIKSIFKQDKIKQYITFVFEKGKIMNLTRKGK